MRGVRVYLRNNVSGHRRWGHPGKVAFALVAFLLFDSGAYAQTQTTADYCFTHPGGIVKTSIGNKISCSEWYQQGTPPAIPVSSDEEQTIDCRDSEKVPSEAYRSCESFKGLLAAHDKDVLDRVTGTSLEARVCFVGGEDNFFILSYIRPVDDLWKHDKTGSFVAQGTLYGTLARYRDGVSSDFYYFTPLVWRRIDSESPPWANGTEATRNLVDGTLEITSDEATITGKFLNKHGGTTSFELSIRLTTNRFKESWDWHTTGKDSQAGGDSDTGYCFHYRDGRLRH